MCNICTKWSISCELFLLFCEQYMNRLRLVLFAEFSVQTKVMIPSDDVERGSNAHELSVPHSLLIPSR